MINPMSEQVLGVISAAQGEPVRTETVIVPDPGPGEALVRVAACGVCRIHGERFSSFDFRQAAHDAVVVLAVEPRRRLMRNHV